MLKINASNKKVVVHHGAYLRECVDDGGQYKGERLAGAGGRHADQVAARQSRWPPLRLDGRRAREALVLHEGEEALYDNTQDLSNISPRFKC